MPGPLGVHRRAGLGVHHRAGHGWVSIIAGFYFSTHVQHTHASLADIGLSRRMAQRWDQLLFPVMPHGFL